MKKNSIYVLTIILYIFVFVSLVVINLNLMDKIINSDIAGELVFAKTIYNTHSLLPLNWCFSTEIRLILVQIIAPILMNFTNSNHILLVITNFISYFIIIILSFILFKKLKINNRYSAFMALFFISPISTSFIYYYLIGNWYLTYTVLELLYIILLLNLVDKKNKINYILFGIISLLLGLFGFRFIVCVLLPLIIMYIINLYKTKNIKNKYTKIIILSTSCMIIGFLINTLILQNIYSVYDRSTTMFIDLNNFYKAPSILFKEFLKFFGYNSNAFVFSMSGILNIFSFIIPVIIILILINVFKNNKNKYINFLKYFFLYSLISLIFFTVFMGKNGTFQIKNKYYITAIILVIPLIIYYLKYTNKVNRIIVITTFSIYIIISSISNIIYYTNNDNNYINTNKLKDMTDYLIDNEYYSCYASFWNANMIEYYSNGKINVGSLEENNMYYPYYWLTNKDYYSVENKCVVLDETETILNSEEYTLIYSNDYYYLYV